jgi:hypothetical protein
LVSVRSSSRAKAGERYTKLLNMPQRECIALLIGTGSVENAWNPVIKAFKDVMNIKVTPDGANFLFANSIYLLRFYSSIGHPDASKLLEISKQNIYLLKKTIAKNLHRAYVRKEIKARPALKKILQKYVIAKDKSFSVITTNWDKTVDEIVSEEMKVLGIDSPNPVFHIHGDVSDFENLYLPSEITDETFRTKGESFKIGLKHTTAGVALEKSNHLIIYGLSLDPLDVELAQTLTSAFYSKNLREVTIINLEDEKAKILERVRLLSFLRSDLKINFVDANSL